MIAAFHILNSWFKPNRSDISCLRSPFSHWIDNFDGLSNLCYFRTLGDDVDTRMNLDENEIDLEIEKINIEFIWLVYTENEQSKNEVELIE